MNRTIKGTLRLSAHTAHNEKQEMHTFGKTKEEITCRWVVKLKNVVAEHDMM
jgi:hypothetical protein